MRRPMNPHTRIVLMDAQLVLGVAIPVIVGLAMLFSIWVH